MKNKIFFCTIFSLVFWGNNAQSQNLTTTELLYQNDLKYDFLNVVGSISTQLNNNDIAANFVMRLENRKAIWISAKTMGIEVGRVLITPDSVKVLNHLNRSYYAREFGYLSQVTGTALSFYELQNILVGNMGAFLPLVQRIEQRADSSLFLSADTLNIGYLFEVNQVEGKVKNSFLSAKDSDAEKTLSVLYGAFQAIDMQRMPTNISLKVVYNDAPNEANFVYDKFNFATSLAMPLKKPANYAEK